MIFCLHYHQYRVMKPLNHDFKVQTTEVSKVQNDDINQLSNIFHVLHIATSMSVAKISPVCLSTLKVLRVK